MSLNHIKSAGRRNVVSDLESLPDEPQSMDSPEQNLERKELAADVRAFMATLPPAQRAIFELRFYKNLTFDEIAKVTNRAVGTVKTGYREAVKKLRIHAEAKGWRS